MTNQEIHHQTNRHLKEIGRQLKLIAESLQRIEKPPMYIIPQDVVDKGWTPPEQILPDPRPLEVRD